MFTNTMRALVLLAVPLMVSFGTPAQSQDKAPRTDNHGDPLPDGALVRLGTERYRCGYSVSFLTYSADGKTIAYGGSGNVDNVIRVADAQTGKLLKTELRNRFHGHLAVSA